MDDVVIKDIFVDLSVDSNDSNAENVHESSVIIKTSNANVNEKPKKKVRNKFKWTKHSEWDSLDAALDFLEEEGFTLYDDKELNMGQKFYFRCKWTPKSVKTYCASRFILFLPSDSNDIILQHNGNEHDHDAIMQNKNRMLSIFCLTLNAAISNKSSNLSTKTRSFCSSYGNFFAFGAFFKFIHSS